MSQTHGGTAAASGRTLVEGQAKGGPRPLLAQPPLLTLPSCTEPPPPAAAAVTTQMTAAQYSSFTETDVSVSVAAQVAMVQASACR